MFFSGEVPLRETHESKEEFRCHFSSLHVKLLCFCLLYKLISSAILCLLTILNEKGVDVRVSAYLFKKLQAATKVQVLKNTLSCSGDSGYLSIFDNLVYCIKNACC